jgi:hypothetical protein
MAKSISVKRKKPGRPATGTEPLYGVRIGDALMKEITGWAKAEGASRSEAIRRLVEIGLTVRATKPKQAPLARAVRAKELAAQAIDKMGDPAASTEQRDERRRRLTKGPPEFRDVRVDRTKK